MRAILPYGYGRPRCVRLAAPMSDFKFCPKCGGALESGVGKNATRLRCAICGFVLFRNPVVGAAVVVMNKGNILLGRRAENRSLAGLWCIPCGYVEWGEDVREAAPRECLEETGLEIRIGDVYAVHSNFHNPESLTVGVWFKTEIIGGTLRAGDDLDEVGFYSLQAVPEPLAFPTDALVLEQLRAEAAGRR